MSENASKGRFLKLDELQMTGNKGKGKEKKKERGEENREKRKKKAIVALLVFMMATFS